MTICREVRINQRTVSGRSAGFPNENRESSKKKQLGVEVQFPELPGSLVAPPLILKKGINSDSLCKKVLLFSAKFTPKVHLLGLSPLYNSKEGSSLEEGPHVACCF